jgi:hypothetical protein
LRKFRSGLDMVEAVQVTDSAFDAPHPNKEHVVGVTYDPLRRMVLIGTYQGVKTGVVGDWIVRTANGQLDICKADAFAKRYEPWTAPVLRLERRARK